MTVWSGLDASVGDCQSATARYVLQNIYRGGKAPACEGYFVFFFV